MRLDKVIHPFFKFRFVSLSGQTLKTQLAVGEEFAKIYQQWAWDKGKNHFPAELFSDAVPVQAYIKYSIAQHLTKITPAELAEIKDKDMMAEIAALQGIMPHAVITTNYDSLLELVFHDYQPVIGQSIIRDAPVLFGEIFKIHVYRIRVVLCSHSKTMTNL